MPFSSRVEWQKSITKKCMNENKKNLLVETLRLTGFLFENPTVLFKCAIYFV